MNAQKKAGNEKQEKGVKKKSFVAYIFGSIVVFMAACAWIPMVMEKITGLLYKVTMNTKKYEDDNWGPVVEKKSSAEIDNTGED